MKLTKPQRTALAALAQLHLYSRAAGFKRWDIGRIAKSSCSSYPLATMTALWRLGFAAPLSDETVELVRSGQCRCGCDLWRITADGEAALGSMRVVVLHGEGGALPHSAGPVTEEEKRQHQEREEEFGHDIEEDQAGEEWKHGQ